MYKILGISTKDGRDFMKRKKGRHRKWKSITAPSYWRNNYFAKFKIYVCLFCAGRGNAAPDELLAHKHHEITKAIKHL